MPMPTKPKASPEGFDDLYKLESEIEDEGDLLQNQRVPTQRRLEQLGIYVDEATTLSVPNSAKTMGFQHATSLRMTINELAAHLKEAGNSCVVACYKSTGTPYVGNRLLPEVAHAFGLKDAMDEAYLKRVDIDSFSNTKDKEFIRAVVQDFWKKHEGQKSRGCCPNWPFSPVPLPN